MKNKTIKFLIQTVANNRFDTYLYIYIFARKLKLFFQYGLDFKRDIPCFTFFESFESSAIQSCF